MLSNSTCTVARKWLGRETLLDRHCDVTPAGEYRHREGEVLSNMVGAVQVESS